jgi:hypothetical protein
MAHLLEQPACVRCGARMMLARIFPEDANSDTWSYECVSCDHVQTRQVAVDRIRSCKDWLSGGLRPPN